MRCDEWVGRLESYLDGELDPEASDLFVGHHESCSRCAGRLEDRRRLRNLFRESLDLGAPSDLAQMILAATASSRHSQPRPSQNPTGMDLAERLFGWIRGELRVPLIAGALGLLLILILQLGDDGGRPDAFAHPSEVVVVRYAEVGGVDTSPEMGGLILGDPRGVKGQGS